MTAVLRAESRKRVRGTVVLVVVFALFSAMYFWMFPSIGADIEDLFEAFPDAFFDVFGIEALHTIEGFIAAELYSFFWVVLLGLYFAYLGAGSIASDIDSRRMDLLLASPVSRESILLQKVATLWVPLLVLNVTVPVIVYVGAAFIGEAFNPVALVMAHALSVPYLLVCAGVGLVLSVTLDRARTAKATALGAVFVLWLVDGVSNIDPEYEWVGRLTPSHYYDETAILVHEEYALVDAGMLCLVFLGLLGLALVGFARRDI